MTSAILCQNRFTSLSSFDPSSLCFKPTKSTHGHHLPLISSLTAQERERCNSYQAIKIQHNHDCPPLLSSLASTPCFSKNFILCWVDNTLAEALSSPYMEHFACLYRLIPAPHQWSLLSHNWHPTEPFLFCFPLA